MDIAITNVQRVIPIPVDRIKKIIFRCAKYLKLNHVELSVVFVGEKRMQRINRQFLGHDYVTDIITFQHGELIICPQVAKRQAKQHEQTLDNELILYVIHGLLHLAGYDDHHADDIKQMRHQEALMIKKFASQ